MSNPTNPPLSRRAARQAELSAHDAPPEGFAQPGDHRPRGGAPVSVPSSAPSDIAYRTQVRPRVPHYDAAPVAHEVITGNAPPLVEPSSVTPLHTAAREPLVETAPAPPVAPSAAAVSQMRRRDFRPPAPVSSPPGDTVAFAPPSFDTELEYHTQVTPRPDARPAPPATDTVTGAGAQPPMHVIAPGATSAVIEPVMQTPAEPAREQTLSRREMRALREAAGLPPEGAEAPPSEAAAPAVVAAPPIVFAPPVAPAVLSPAPPSSAPTGSHWSVGIHDDDDPFENTFSREVGSAVSMTNTNALVLPEMPLGGLTGPVSGTGEIIITGMIDLPLAVSSTGTVPTVHESPDIDDLFDAGDLSAVPADAAPVSALRAVSSHTGSNGFMTTGRRPSGNAVTTVLVASTVVMAVVAIGLFVLAAVNGLV